MYLHNAIKKLEKFGEVKNEGSFYWVERDGEIVSITRNGGEGRATIATINVRNVNDHDDYQTDYHAGIYCRNLSQAIRLAGWDRILA